MKKFSILHISDLHKAKEASYEILFDSLTNDCEHYTENNILKPSIIVISGDLIQGVDSHTTKEDAQRDLSQQYKEVGTFLNKLVDYFLNGDKRRIIIVPGNHDVDRYSSFQSMDKLTDENREKYFNSYKNMEGGSIYRWSWKDFSFYQITNENLYKERFKVFYNFYNTFYEGAKTFPDDYEDKAVVFDIPEYNITFACFNSCKDLDNLNYIGKISFESLNSITNDLSDAYYRGRLIVGVWHHHIYGSPYYPNFMDRRILQNMRDKHISMGLFGHQHSSEVAEEYHNLEDDSTNGVLLVGSGTLFGNRSQMIPGVKRQYNIIEVEMDNGSATVKIHTREDITGDSLYPSRRTRCLIGKNNYIQAKLTFRTIDYDDEIRAIDQKAHNTSNYWQGCLDMQSLYNTSLRDIAIKYTDSYLNRIEKIDNVQYEHHFSSPQSETQLRYLVECYIEDHKLDEAEDIIHSISASWLNRPLLLELEYEINKNKSQTKWQRLH